VLISQKTRALILGILVTLVGTLSSPAYADIVDEENTPPPSKTPQSTEVEAASTEREQAVGKKDDAKPLKSPAPHNKDTRSSNTTTVIPPKSPEKSSKLGEAVGKKSVAKAPVHFESNGLKGLREKGMVELVQQVIVTQEDMKLESDVAQVFFDEASHEVIKVLAQGRVRINGIDQNSGEKFRALADKAVFLNSERTVVLDGNAKLWRGDDSVIRSRKITYEMGTGWIRADRVAGEVQSDGKSMEAGKTQKKAAEKKK
jgi:lipopolysaccharide transport protein LptA